MAFFNREEQMMLTCATAAGGSSTQGTLDETCCHSGTFCVCLFVHASLQQKVGRSALNRCANDGLRPSWDYRIESNEEVRS